MTTGGREKKRKKCTTSDRQDGQGQRKCPLQMVLEGVVGKT